MPPATIHIISIRESGDLAAASALFRAYAASLPVDLAYQGFPTEVATLPGRYAPPRGELLLARDADGTAVGCVGLRPMEADGICEMKRLFVAPEGRGRGLGRRLVEAIVATASAIARCGSTRCRA